MNGPVSEQAITRIEILDATFRPADHAEQLSQNDSDNGALVT